MTGSTLPIRRTVVALIVSSALLVGGTACSSNDTTKPKKSATVAADVAEPTASSSAEKQKFAKTRFVANAGLAAGATYQWIVKPYRKGKFKKGAHGRKLALVKAGVAGAFAYNRLKAAVKNAKGDPLLSKAVAPLTAGIDKLKEKDAGKSAGAEVKNKVPSAKELSSGS
ncbi:hypothetical protein [Streptomyces sp. NPDC055134]